MGQSLGSSEFMDNRSTNRCLEGWGCSKMPIVIVVSAEQLRGELSKKTAGFLCFPYLLTPPSLDTGCRAREGSALPHCGIFCALTSFVYCSDHHTITA